MVADAIQTVLDPWGDVHERHKIRIYESSIGGVTGLLPESVAVAVSNSYSPPFGTYFQSLNTGVVAAQELANNTGQADFSAVFKELTSQVWGGGSPAVFPLKLLYLARTDPNVDVLQPLQRLIQLSTGRISGMVSKKVLGKPLTVTNVKPPPKVQVELGTFMRFARAVIKSISWDITNRSAESGVPTKVFVNLQIETSTMYINDDKDVIIGLGGWAKT